MAQLHIERNANPKILFLDTFKIARLLHKKLNPVMPEKIYKMACTNCSTSVGNAPGCKSKGACSTGNCGKMPVFNWLSNMSLPAGKSP